MLATDVVQTKHDIVIINRRGCLVYFSPVHSRHLTQHYVNYEIDVLVRTMVDPIDHIRTRWLSRINQSYELDPVSADELAALCQPLPCIPLYIIMQETKARLPIFDEDIMDDLMGRLHKALLDDNPHIPEPEQRPEAVINASDSESETELELELDMPDMLSLPRHLTDKLWGEGQDCIVCLEHIPDKDHYKISVCCGGSYCSHCFDKLKRCAHCRNLVFSMSS